MKKKETIVRSIPPDRREVIGVAWISHDPNSSTLHLLKIHRTVSYIPTPEGDHGAVGYKVEYVTGEKWPGAFEWLKHQCPWRAWGVYYCGSPGLIWTLDIREIQKAFEVLARPDGLALLPEKEILQAPVRFASNKTLRPYPHIVTTRNRRDMWALRQRYPSAGELSWLPQELLYRQFGPGFSPTLPLSASYSPAHT